MEYITTFYILLLCVIQLFLGLSARQLGLFCLARLGVSVNVGQSNEAKSEHGVNSLTELSGYWFLGLLLHLGGVLVVKSLALSWMAAIFIPLLFSIPGLLIASNVWQCLKVCLSRIPDPVFLVWIGFHAVVGMSLFSLENGISTPWVNNYGDLAFHLGMIHFFAFQGDFPPEYHIFAGETLSYPFFVNLWTTVLWWPFESFVGLKTAFFFQWCLLWSCVYLWLTQGRGRILPFLLVFGGGSLVAIWQFPATFSWQLIGEGFPWSTWLSTIWVTQRSALFGLASSALILRMAIAEKSQGKNPSSVMLAGLILGLSPLIHTHFFLFTALFVGLYYSNNIAIEMSKKHFSLRGILELRSFQTLSTVVLCSLPALLFFPLLMGKASMASFMLGWTVPFHTPGFESLVDSAEMWLLNASPWVALVAFAWWVTKAHTLFITWLILFLLGNTLKLAVWEWDQIKVFLCLFFFSVFAFRMCWIDLWVGHKRWVLSAFFILLMFPAVWELGRVVQGWHQYQIYSNDKIALAAEVRRLTSKSDVIASPDQHNSAATLTGRRLFFGYPGTLASHRLEYQSREGIQKNLSAMARCEDNRLVCPRVLVWDRQATSYWGMRHPPSEFKKLQTKSPDGTAIYVIDEK